MTAGYPGMISKSSMDEWKRHQLECERRRAKILGGYANVGASDRCEGCGAPLVRGEPCSHCGRE